MTARLVQIQLTARELQEIDDWRFKHRMPTRAAAVRELMRLGLQTLDGRIGLPGSDMPVRGTKGLG